jgi:hypothetical protein
MIFRNYVAQVFFASSSSWTPPSFDFVPKFETPTLFATPSEEHFFTIVFNFYLVNYYTPAIFSIGPNQPTLLRTSKIQFIVIDYRCLRPIIETFARI